MDRPGHSAHDVEYDPQSEAFLTRFDWEEPGEPSTTLVVVMAKIQDVDPTEVRTLNGVLDPDALDALFSGRPGDPTDRPSHVSIPFQGYDIRVFSDGEVVAEPVQG